MFRTVPLSIISSFSLYTQQYIHVLLTACEQDQGVYLLCVNHFHNIQIPNKIHSYNKTNQMH